jgi:hypothetical protein
MNCERFKIVVDDLAREQPGVVIGKTGIGIDTSIDIDIDIDIAPDERALALEHAVRCDACGLIWEEERSLTTGLRNLAVEMKSLTAPPQLEAKVLAAFRERAVANDRGRENGKAAISAFRPRRLPGQTPGYWVAAIAAVLLVVFAMVVVRSGILSPSKPQLATEVTPKEKVRPEIASEPIKNTAVVPTGEETQQATPASHNGNYQAPPRRVRGRFGARAISASLGDVTSVEGNTEIVTDFFPINYGNTPNLQEGGQLMRVELPRAAMARFGLPVNMDRAGDTVKADVLVGADGLAQAIRFVH